MSLKPGANAAATKASACSRVISAENAAAHRRIGQERLVDRRRNANRRRSEDQETLGARQVRRGFEQDVAAQAPADEHRLLQMQRLDQRPQRAGVAGQPIGGGIIGVRRGAMAHQVDGDEPVGAPERPLQLALEGAGGRRISVQQHHQRPLAAAVLNAKLHQKGLQSPTLPTSRPPSERPRPPKVLYAGAAESDR